MWNLDGRRWEWWRRGGRLSIWNGSIHLPFLLVSKCVQWKGKARWGKLISKKRNHFIADHTVKHISPLGLVQAAYPKLLVILFISEGMNVCGFTLLLLVVFVKGILIHFKSHFHLLHPVSLENTWTSFTSFFFFFPFLKCLLLLLVCQCVSEESYFWKRALFRFALSMETRP